MIRILALLVLTSPARAQTSCSGAETAPCVPRRSVSLPRAFPPHLRTPPRPICGRIPSQPHHVSPPAHLVGGLTRSHS